MTQDKGHAITSRPEAGQVSSDVPTNRYHFVLEGSGLGESTYRVSGAGDLTRLRVRYEATEWQRANSSYTDGDWQRAVL